MGSVGELHLLCRHAVPHRLLLDLDLGPHIAWSGEILPNDGDAIRDVGGRGLYPTDQVAICNIEDLHSIRMVYHLLNKEGFLLGSTSGVKVFGAYKLALKLGPGSTIVTILCDRSDKYNSKLFNKKFLQEKGLPFPNWI